MFRCTARVKPIGNDCGRGDRELLIEFNCIEISDAELRRERYAEQNERAVENLLEELERRRDRFCKRRRRHECHSRCC